ncbi:lysophospholipid acyltransferase family protein [Planktosalinus lacus]|uniref:1-acyl-sn-glycerol-3-phosphate acyltransferase n=1 Tax=Planktosalinus lacus TaxID=1526573 RepID=A0A8J2Y9X4_9FLAO|nr:lysophospholipid acyltransferase family protein [Planktosalinus lacus]GGD94850.1 1-acyl-sn-glycerol-3-phosphate acyltransferase [Planktosalinus lacus]
MKSFVLKIFSYIFSVLFYLIFGVLLLLFEVIQRICLNVFGYTAHKKSVSLFNWLVLRSLHVLGTTYTIQMPKILPDREPVIIVSNHQSMWDIPPLIWFLRKLHPKFISKKELGKGIPTISYNLKHGGSVLIDRKNPKQAAEEIKKIAHYISKHNRSVVIFPEGTRSRNGTPKPFKQKGLKILFEHASEAYVLPVSISGSWKLQKYGVFPIPLGVHLQFHIQEPLKVSEFNHEELIHKLEKLITENVILE